jgi:hypothetical protein
MVREKSAAVAVDSIKEREREGRLQGGEEEKSSDGKKF